ncbi:MAG: S-methyl-5'-thioadenosine phosphorylase [Spirochaetota bacterium]|nr:S-methyl-5'-thioadenosine phosphorylase [Spirochaetota bacterium]
MGKASIGIIGGSGVYDIEGLNILEEVLVETPFGKPSDKIIICDVKGEKVAFLPRHGKGHRILPTEVPSKANIYALKSLGVNLIISISAVGSLKEKIKPQDFVIPDQIIDRTKSRDLSFFGNGIVGHVTFAEPFCKGLSEYLYNSILKKKVVDVHKNETYLCMEGPIFSTKAESKLYRSWGCGIIGMTVIPEAKLAREAEICYATIAMSTDYDCWHEEEESVTIEMILENMHANVNRVKSLLVDLVTNIPDLTKCTCRQAAKDAIITNRSIIPDKVKKELNLLYEKYF